MKDAKIAGKCAEMELRKRNFLKILAAVDRKLRSSSINPLQKDHLLKVQKHAQDSLNKVEIWLNKYGRI